MNTHLEPLLPILLPLFLAAITLVFRSQAKLQRGSSIFGAILLVAISTALLWDVSQHGTLVVYLGNWAPPFGISIVADILSSLLVATTSVISFIIVIFSLNGVTEEERGRGFYPFVFMMIAGVNGAFLTGDIFNLYVWFEVMLISSYALLMLGRTKAQIQASIKYFILNMVKTMLFLTSIALLYGTMGTLNMADLHLAVQDLFAYGNPATLQIIALMMLFAFGIKAGMFPLYFWLPASYHTPSPAIGALFAALLTKVGVYAMLRVFTLVLPFDQLGLLPLISILAFLTMLVPILGAIKENNLKRVLSFCLLSHIGTMLVGLAVYNEAAFSGTVFYMVHHMFVMAYLFLAAGMVCKFFNTDDMRLMGGLEKLRPFLSWLFFIAALTLAGIPPLSGFWPKLLLIKGGLLNEQYLLVAAILVSGLLTLYVMIRVWHQIAWRNYPTQIHYYTDKPMPPLMLASILLLCAVAIGFGIYPEPLIKLSSTATASLLDPYVYVDAVTGGVQ